MAQDEELRTLGSQVRRAERAVKAFHWLTVMFGIVAIIGGLLISIPLSPQVIYLSFVAIVYLFFFHIEARFRWQQWDRENALSDLLTANLEWTRQFVNLVDRAGRSEKPK